jgi:hypothetical protein
MLPVRVAIRNDSGRSRRWTFQFRSQGGSRQQSAAVLFDWEAEVGSGQEQLFDLLVPLAMVDSQNYSYPNLIVSVNGYGLLHNQASYSVSHSYSGKPHTGCTGMSKALAVETEGPLRSELDTRGFELVLCTLDPAWLSDDWRAYLGFASVWFADQDWSQLRESQRGAILQWVWQGGTLYYAGRDLGDQALARAGLPSVPAASGLVYGAGRLIAVPWTSGALALEETAAGLMASYSGSHVGDVLDGRYRTHWNLLLDVPPQVLRIGWLVAALIVFALLVGPVNLMVFASRTRRHRLFVTTPAISLAASLLLVLLILLQDGVGGAGSRLGMLCLMPSTRQEWLVQEQISRTGVLLKRRFALPRDVYMASIPVEIRPGDAPRLLRQTTETADGDWFSSRSRQGQYLSVIRPSRARVEVLNSRAVREGSEAPILLSTLEEALTDVFYRDVRGGYWQVDQLQVGERAVLRPSSREDYEVAWGGERRRSLAVQQLPADAFANHPHGYVVGASGSPGARLIDTLPSIRWQREELVVLGPCVAGGEGSG